MRSQPRRATGVLRASPASAWEIMAADPISCWQSTGWGTCFDAPSRVLLLGYCQVWRWLARRGHFKTGLADRSSRPKRSPRRLSVEVEQRIERLRRDRKLGPDRIAYELRREGVQVSASGVQR
jgi:hypothetical protein